MRHLLTALALLVAVPLAAQDVTPRVLVSGMEGPWDITWGPDGMLWVTERIAGRITRVDPDSGALMPAATLPDVAVPGWQDGLLGLALDPGLLTGSPFVYAAHTYDDPTRPADDSYDADSPYRQLYTRIVRLTYDPATGTLSDAMTVIDGLPAGQDHNAGRLVIAPDGMLHYTIGDMGRGQFGQTCFPNEAQRLPTGAEMAGADYAAYVGKSLRIAPDGSVPPDNPVWDGVQSHIFTVGHRNPQGLVFGPDGTLYSSEQGPKTDDEVNILTAGGNYGWPHVSGFRDDAAYQFAEWWADPACSPDAFSDITIPASVPVTAETAWDGALREPLATLFTVPTGHDFADPACGGMNYICWPTVAASSIDIYPAGLTGWPALENSLLVTALKRGSVYRIPLTPDGQAMAAEPERLWRTDNRYRDLAISPDGRRVFVITDVAGRHDSADGGVMEDVVNPGAILVFDAP